MARKRKKDKFEDPAVKGKKKFKELAMLGRKISLEERGPNAKKLGRRFKHGKEGGERCVVTLMLKKGSIERLLKKFKDESKAKIIARLIEKEVG